MSQQHSVNVSPGTGGQHMPALFEHPARKYRCRSCGWKIIRTSFKEGDCITPCQGMAVRGVTECPECGSNDIETTDPSVLEMMDPFGGKKWKEHMGRRRPRFDT